MKHLLMLLGLVLATANLKAYEPISDDKLNELIQSFNYQPELQILKKGKVGCAAQSFSYKVNYPQRHDPLVIKGKSFIPIVLKDQEKVPVVFILPPMGGTNILDKGMGRTLCENRIAAFVISSNLTGLNSENLVPVSDHDHTHRRVASAIKGGMLFVKSYPEINSEKVGLFGVSLGGILGSIAYSVIPEISAASFVVNGADVPHILANSKQSEIVKLRKARKKEQGFKTDAEYEAYLNQNLELDPLHFVKLIDPNTLKMYIALNDTLVPSVDQLRYYEALGSPKSAKFYKGGHISTIITVLALSREKTKISQWFLKKFSQPNPRLKRPKLIYADL